MADDDYSDFLPANPEADIARVEGSDYSNLFLNPCPWTQGLNTHTTDTPAIVPLAGYYTASAPSPITAENWHFYACSETQFNFLRLQQLPIQPGEQWGEERPMIGRPRLRSVGRKTRRAHCVRSSMNENRAGFEPLHQDPGW
jgi:hypothetical protein